MEAEVKSEATGGRVSVETKDQKVWLHLFPVLAPLPAPPPPTPHPGVQHLVSALCMKGGLGAYKGERRRLVDACLPACHSTIRPPLHVTASR